MSNGSTHIYTHKDCNQTHTVVFLQGKLVLINLAGGTRHVFPFTSWSVPWVAQWKPSILVCLQFVSLNFLLICIIQRWPAGLVQEVLSEDCCGIFYSDIDHAFRSLKKTKGIAQLDHRASKNEGFVYLKVYRETFTISYLISMIHEMAKQWGGVQAFHCMTNGCKCFSLILLLSELRILQLITPLTFFSFKRSL